MTKHCLIYRSEKKQETYLYLPIGTSYSDLPEELQEAFGEPTLVMKLEIGTNTKLVQADTMLVIKALEDPGYFLQLPPKTPVEELISRRFGDADSKSVD
jgi:hypothetical protein